MPLSGSENAWIRVILLGLVGVLAVLSLVGIVVLSALGREVPPTLAGALGAAMGAITTLLTPVRPSQDTRVDPEEVARAFERRLAQRTFQERNPGEHRGQSP